MGELQSSLDALTTDDLHTLADGQVLDRVGELQRVINQASAELARTVRHAECTQAAEHDGLKSMRSWLVGHPLLSVGEAGRIVAAGRICEQLPALGAAAASGAVTAAKIAEVGRRLTPERLAAAAAQGHDLAEVDAALTLAAGTQIHERFVAVLTRYVAGIDPDGPEPDPTEGRRLSIARHADGSITGRFDLDPVGGEKVQAAIESIVQAHRPQGDTRTRSQQNADALVQLADNQLASGMLPTLRTVKPHVIVTLDLADLADPGTGAGAAETGFGQQLSAARARWLACDGAISRIVMGPDGQPLDLGRDHRVVTPGLRRAVERRDKGCVFTGCGAPTFWCDVHHILHWIFGGETNLANSALLCERHHTKVHHGFRVQRDPGGRWRTWRPDGTEIVIGPLIT